jgi:hypothetical protein
LREELLAESKVAKDDEPEIEPELNEDGDVHDGLCLSYVIQEEAHTKVSHVLDDVEVQVSGALDCTKISPVVSCNDCAI